MKQLTKLLSKPPAVLGVMAIGHGLNDFVAGYLLGNLLTIHLPLLQASFCFLIYNVLAFGGQYVAALIMTRVDKPTTVYIAAWLLNATALLCFSFFPQVSFIAAGCASALYHVIGGSIAARHNKAAAIGVFAAPGIIGLALAGYLAAIEVNLWFTLTVLTSAFSFTGLLVPFQKITSQTKQASPSLQIEKHDVLMMLLLSVITLRSAVWNIFQLLHQQNYSWLLAIAISAFAGKMVGGYLSDRIGWRAYNLISLLLSAPLLNFFKNDLLLFCLGVALLQSGIPANTAILLQYMQGEREKGIALSFGGAVLAAGVVVLLPSVVSNFYLQLFLQLSAVGISFYLLVKDKSSLSSQDYFKKMVNLLTPTKRFVLKSR